jgi:rare lipoprotein A
MVASYYGRPFDGRLTANGEVYDRRRMTAAHKTIPFGTLLRVTNPKNGRSVVVRVNDRGPFVSGRDLDLSEGAARSLGVLADGVSDVTVEELSEANEVLTGDYVVPVRRP